MNDRCPECATYWDERRDVVYPRFLSFRAFSRYAQGIHERHLNKRSLEVRAAK